MSGCFILHLMSGFISAYFLLHLGLVSRCLGSPMDADTRAEVTCQAEGGRRTLKGSGRLTLWAKKIKGKWNKTRETEMHFLSPAFTSSQMSSNRWLHPIGKMAPGQPICRFISYMPRKTCAGRSCSACV